jgi:hypothetical protein
MSSLPIGQDENVLKHRMGVNSNATNAAGRLNGSLPGCKTIGVCEPVTIGTPITTKGLSSLPACLFSLNYFETGSNDENNLTIVTGTGYASAPEPGAYAVLAEAILFLTIIAKRYRCQ